MAARGFAAPESRNPKHLEAPGTCKAASLCESCADTSTGETTGLHAMIHRNCSFCRGPLWAMRNILRTFTTDDQKPRTAINVQLLRRSPELQVMASSLPQRQQRRQGSQPSVYPLSYAGTVGCWLFASTRHKETAKPPASIGESNSRALPHCAFSLGGYLNSFTVSSMM